ncbi:MAG: sulfatase/phosphatase domain-containing protein, partial [Bacteroidota bacterium]
LKGSQYEGGHRVPCCVRWPAGKISDSKDIDLLTAHVDLLPTFMDLASLETAESLALDGTSLAPLLRGEGEEARFAERVIITDTQRDEWPEKWKKSATMQGKWRLINQDELYDIQADPGQRNNIAEAHPEVLRSLQEAYEAWWTELEPGFQHFSRALIGAQEKSVMLYGHDWHNIVDNFGQKGRAAWHQDHIRQGLLANGDWAVEFAQSGTYEFELWRWPEESKLAITAGLPVKAAVPGGKPSPAGNALPIKQARLEIAGQSMQAEVPAEATSICFQMQVEAGPTMIKTYFEGEGDLRLGAYYVRATYLN